MRTHLSRVALAELGLGANTPLAFRPVRSRVHNGTWTGVAASVDGARERAYSGRLEQNAIRINSVTMVKCDAVEFLGERTEFSEWEFNERIGSMVSGRVEGYDSHGRLEWRQTLIELGEVAPEQLASVIRVPSYGSSDAVRGVVTPENILDARPGIAKVTTRDAQGVRVDPMPLGVSPSGRSFLRVVGWSIAAVVVVVLVWIRVRAIRGK